MLRKILEKNSDLESDSEDSDSDLSGNDDAGEKDQGTLAEGEGSVRLISFVKIRCFIKR